MGNPVVRWQIVARDPEAVAGFYSNLFGWKVDKSNAFEYRELLSGDTRGIDGGVWPSPPEGHNLLQLFIEVPDVDAAMARAADLGARVVIPRSALPDGDVMAILVDPAGLSFGLVQKATSPA